MENSDPNTQNLVTYQYQWFVQEWVNDYKILTYNLCLFKQIFKMRPSPFAGKLKKRQIKLEKQEDKQQQAFDEGDRQPQNNHLKPPTSNKMLKISKDKDKEKSKSKEAKEPKNIYDVLKDDQQTQKLQTKGSTTFKPNLKLKTGKKLKLLPTAQSKKQQETEQPPQQPHRPILKPPLFKKGDTNTIEKNKEQVLINQDRSPRNNKNIEEESFEGSGSANQSMSMAPRFKIKARQQPQFPVIKQQPMEHTGFAATNFADMKIETRQINLQPSQFKVSEVRIQKQQARTKALANLLNLEVDLFEQTLNISCVTPYQIYINKIKNGSLKNSNDQSFDEKSHATSQTATLQFQDFMNQCPQDYHTDVSSIVQNDQTEAFNRFVSKMSPVLQQLIKPSNSVVMPPIFLLALRPEFKKLVSCPFPVFIYYSAPLKLGIAVIGQKLYIAEDEIETVTSLNSNLIGGSKSGILYLWSGKNDKGSRLYRKVMQYTQTTNFELPEYSTQQLDRFSIYRGQAAIVSLLLEGNDEFVSLDASCKMIRWKIQKGNHNSTKIIPESSFQFGNLVQRPNLIGYDVKKRNNTYFICCSAGVLVWNGEEIIQRLDTEGFKVNNLALPYRTHFIYAICEDCSVRIYEQHYANELFKIYIPNGYQPVDIIVPQTQYDNKKLSLSSRVYVITSSGAIYTLNLLKGATQVKLLKGIEEKKDRDVIFRGVNKMAKGFELVQLWRDLKCTSELKKMDVNLEPTVANIKAIVEENRQLYSWLESENAITIVQ